MGSARDQNGGAIRDAYVLVHWDPAGSQVGLTDNVGLDHDKSTTSDRMGKFSIELPPGFYDVFVSAMGFSPNCTKIRIKAGKTIAYNSKMRVDRLVENELGDRF